MVVMEKAAAVEVPNQINARMAIVLMKQTWPWTQRQNPAQLIHQRSVISRMNVSTQMVWKKMKDHPSQRFHQDVVEVCKGIAQFSPTVLRNSQNLETYNVTS